MRNFKMSGKVKVSFNDSKDNNKFYKANEDIFIANRDRYEELYYKGFLEEGKEINDKKIEIKDTKKED